jgi:hypothetical protein
VKRRLRTVAGFARFGSGRFGVPEAGPGDFRRGLLVANEDGAGDFTTSARPLFPRATGMTVAGRGLLRVCIDLSSVCGLPWRASCLCLFEIFCVFWFDQ